MSTVIRNSLALEGFDTRNIVSFEDGAFLWSFVPFLRALWAVANCPGVELGVVQVHLSQKGSFVREGILLLTAHWRKRPVVATLHGSRIVHFVSGSRWASFVLRRADCVTVLGAATERSLVKLMPGLEVHLVHNFVADSGISTFSRDPIVVFGGVVGRRKGVDTLLDAWEILRDRHSAARLLIAGPLAVGADAIPGATARMRVPGVTYLGPLCPEDMRSALTTARVAVLPSRAEGMPMFLLEAMAAACAVVTTPVGDIQELIGTAGMIVPVDDARELAEGLDQLLRDDGLAEEFGREAQLRATTEFSGSTAERQLALVYRRATELV